MKTPVLLILVITAINMIACKNQPNTASSGNKSNDSFHIRVNIKNIPGGQAQLIYNGPGESGYQVLDSSAVKNGTFHFSGKLERPEMLTVLIEPHGWTFDVFAENRIISISGDTTGADPGINDRPDGTREMVIKNLVVTGSADHDTWVKYNETSSIKQYEAALKGYYQQSDAAAKNKNMDEAYKFRGLADSLFLLQMAERMKWIDTFSQQQPASDAVAYIFYTIYGNESMTIPHAEQILHAFSGNATASPYYKFVSDNLAKRKQFSPGQTAPDFTLLKRDSSSLTLSSLRGKYVMIDFWASWCHPCRKAIPHWKKIYAKYHAKGFEILSVSDDLNWASWKKAMDMEKMPWLQVCDEFPEQDKPARVGSLYMTTFIPFYVLLDKDGRILVYSGDEKAIDAALEKYL